MSVIKKLNSKKDLILLKSLPFSYFSTSLYLDYIGYILERNDELIITVQDIYYSHEFPALFLPKKHINWQEASVTLTTDDDIKKINKKGIKIIINKPLGAEFFYRTRSLLQPTSGIKRRIEQFKKNYQYKISYAFPKEKIKDFYYQWKKQKKRTNANFLDAEKFFFFCLDNLRKYEIKQVYVIVNNKLIGFAWGIKHSSDNWVGLQLKVDYRFKGLSRFLHHERAKFFKNKGSFTLGTGAQESGIIQFKKELGPIEERNYYYVLTDKKKLVK